ncbi:hypothetical protein HN873_049799 [Arachis hypogaea]
MCPICGYGNKVSVLYRLLQMVQLPFIIMHITKMKAVPCCNLSKALLLLVAWRPCDELKSSQFFGEVPPQISHLRNLLILDLRSYFEYILPNPINKLQLKISTLRSLIQNATSLEVLRLSFVTISSSIPDMLTKHSST